MTAALVRQRPKLVGPTGLIVLALALIAPFGLILQNPDSLIGYIKARPADAVSIRYLELMLQMKPGDENLRLTLIEQMLSVGQVEPAGRYIDSLPPDAGTDSEDLRRLRNRIDYLTLTSLKAADPRREVIRQRLLKRLENGVGPGAEYRSDTAHPLAGLLSLLIPDAAAAAGDTPPSRPEPAMSMDELRENADMALALNKPELAAAYYMQMARKDTVSPLHWYREAARWYVAGRHPRDAGLALQQASLAQSSEAQAAGLAREAIKTLQAGSEFDTALEVARADIARFPDDRELLDAAITLALAAGRPAAAEVWATRLSELSNADPAVLKRQLDIELAARNLDGAVSTATALTRAEPDDPAHREKLAQVATWAGRSDIALGQRLWLVQHGHAQDNLEPALGLAVASHDDAAWMQLIETGTAQRVLQGTSLQDALTIYGRNHQGVRLEHLLNRQLAAHPDQRALWQALAQTQIRNRRLESAAKTWAAMSLRFGVDETSLTGEADALQAAGRNGPALSLLKAHQASMPGTALRYWRSLGQLAGAEHDAATAAQAYQVLAASPLTTTADAERLIASQLALGRTDDAIASASRAAGRFGQDRFQLQALQLALKEGRWAQLDTLLTAAMNTPLAKTEPYWLIRAEQFRHQQNPTETLVCYRRALELDPASVGARTGLLWTLIGLKDKTGLADALPRWQHDAETDPAYWGAYASGLIVAGEPDAALPWFEKQARSGPDDGLWRLAYADALDTSGRRRQANAARHQVYTRLQSERRQGERWSDPAIKLAYARLLSQFSRREEASYIDELAAENVTDPAIREHLIGYYLNRQRYRDARRWMDMAEQNRQVLPAWQRLSMAMAEHDDDTIRRLVQTPDESLDAVSRVEGWKALGENRKALAVAREALASRPDEKAAGTLKAQAADLTALTANKIMGGWRSEKMGPLAMDEYKAGVELPQDRWTVGFEVAQRALSFKGGDLHVNGYRNETELLAGFVLPRDQDRFDAKLGVNQRDDHALFMIRLGWTQHVTEPFTVRWEGAYNQLPYETGYLRAIGAKHHVSAEATYRFDDRNSARVKLELHEFDSRRQDFLGRGYAVEAEVGHTFHQEWPYWRMKLQGGWTQNQLADRVPPELLRQGLSPMVTVGALVPQEYGMAGVGTHIRWGRANGPHIGIEAWAGYIAPAQELAFNVRLSGGTPVFTADDRLSFDAFHASAQSGLATQPYEGIGLTYRLPF